MGALFSRVRHPTDIWDELAKTIPDIRKVSSPTGPDAAAAVDVTTRSFAGTATSAPEYLLDWALGDELKEQWDNPDRVKHVGWALKLAIQCALRHGPKRAVFLASAPGTDAPGAACTVRFLPGKLSVGAEGWMYMWEMIRRSGMPTFDTKNGMDRRFQAAEDAINAAHVKHAPGPHINVQLMAVAPEHQGKKLTSVLMRAVNKVADKHGWPCYLETSGLRNVKVYQRFGYETVERVTVRDPKKPDAPTYDDFYAMIRSPSKVAGAPELLVI